MISQNGTISFFFSVFKTKKKKLLHTTVLNPAK